jgi:phiKZ-like phage internal head proteins
MSKYNGFVLAMEEDGEDAGVQAVELVPETQAEVEVASGEVSEQTNDIADLDGATASAETDAETLEDVATTMQESVESGEGLDETAAKVADIAVESIMARLGIKSATKVIPSLENFGSKSSRVAATKIALEGVMDKVKQIWQAIVNALKSLGAKIVSFIQGLIKHRATLEKHLKGLQARVAKIDASAKPKEQKLKGGFVKGLSVGGKTDASTAGLVLDTAKELQGVMIAGAKQSGMSDKGEAASATDFANTLNNQAQKLKANGQEAEGDTRLKFYGHFVGGKSLAVGMKGEAFVYELRETEKKAATEAEALSKKELESLLGEAIVVIEQLKGVDKVQKDLETSAKGLQQAAEGHIRSIGAADADPEVTKKANESAKGVRARMSAIVKLGSSLPNAMFNAAKVVGDYVAAGASNLEGKAKEEPKK